MAAYQPMDVMQRLRDDTSRRTSDVRLAESIPSSYSGGERRRRATRSALPIQPSTLELVGDRCTKVDVSMEGGITVRYEQDYKKKVTFLGSDVVVHFAEREGRLYVTKYVYPSGTVLHFTREQNGPLMKVDTDSGQRFFLSGRTGRERLVKETFFQSGLNFTYTYQGPPGSERRVHCSNSAGEEYHFVGPSRQERLRSATTAEGVNHFYDGEKKSERKVKSIFPCGFVLHYKADEEAKAMGTFPDGERHYYDGPPGSERIVRVVFPCGKQQRYEGEFLHERVVSQHSPDGETNYYEGPKNQERLVRKEYASTGSVLHYDGPRTQERLVKLVDRYKTEYSYVGERHRERMAESLAVDGSRTVYEGPPGRERIVFMNNASKGTVFHYSGDRRSEYVTRMSNSKGTEYFFSHQRGGGEDGCVSRKRMRRCEDGSVECFDGKGRNVILRCTPDGRATSAREGEEGSDPEGSSKQDPDSEGGPGLFACPICLCSHVDKYAIECGHVLCFQCSHRIFASSKQCPVCRSSVCGRPPLRIFEA